MQFHVTFVFAIASEMNFQSKVRYNTAAINVTIFSGHKTVVYCTVSMLVVATLFKHQDLNIFSDQ